MLPDLESSKAGFISLLYILYFLLMRTVYRVVKAGLQHLSISPISLWLMFAIAASLVQPTSPSFSLSLSLCLTQTYIFQGF